MSRHRNIRSMNYDEECYGYDDVYGHSVEDDYATSPSAAQFMYNRDQAHQMSAYLHTEEDIKEEDEEDDKEMHSLERRDSSVTLPPLGDMEKAQLYSCLDVIRDRLGDSVSEQSAVNAILSHNFDVDRAVNALLSQTTPKAPAVQPLKREPQITPLKAEAEPVAADRTVRVVTANNRVVVSTGFALPEENLVQGVQDATRQMESLKTSNNNSRSTSPAAREVIPVSVPATPRTPAKPREVRPDAATEYAKERGSGKALLNLVVVGHVDAGKSTLMGHMLYKLGQVSSKAMHKFEQESKKLGKQSFMYAWVLDETGEERSRGITMDVGQSQFETDTKSVTLLDAPGHRDFIPNMIFGAAQADVALLVVDATTGEFETGFESGGQTREHALLVRSLGVNQLGVAVNKMDTVGWSRERFEDITKRLGAFLKQAGFKEADVVYVPVSGLSGENLVTRCEDPRLTAWYSGPTLLQVVDNFRPPERPLSKPFRMVVSDIFKSTGSTSGCCLAGRVEGGMVSVGDKVLLMPLNEPVQVKSLLLVDRSATSAFAGDQITLTVTGPDPSNIGLGAVLCDPTDPVKVATRIEARIVIFNIDVPITKGFPVVLHYQSLSEAATIRKLVAQIHKSTGEVIKSRPRCLGKQTSGLVELEINKPVCIELYKDFRELGRFMLRAGGTTIAAGLVTKIF